MDPGIRVLGAVCSPSILVLSNLCHSMADESCLGSLHTLRVPQHDLVFKETRGAHILDRDQMRLDRPSAVCHLVSEPFWGCRNAPNHRHGRLACRSAADDL